MTYMQPASEPHASAARQGGGALRTLADALPVLLSYWDVDERNVFANEAYARWFGMRPGDVRGRHLREVLGPEAYGDDRGHVKGVLNGVPQRFEREVLSLTGTVRVEVTCAPDAIDGKVVGFSVSVTTLTTSTPEEADDTGGEHHLPGVQVRALVVDAQPVARAGLAAILASAPGITVVGEAGDGDEALGAVLDARPDVVVLDSRAPGARTLLAARHRGQFPAVVVLVESELDEYLLDPIGLGASGVLAKGAAPEELPEVVRVATKGGDGGGRRSRPIGMLGERLVSRPTAREREVLELLQCGMPNADIATTLGMSVNTVKSHVKHLYAKLGVRSRQELIGMGSTAEHGL
jgi:PAS domain S-box-containing protein